MQVYTLNISHVVFGMAVVAVWQWKFITWWLQYEVQNLSKYVDIYYNRLHIYYMQLIHV